MQLFRSRLTLLILGFALPWLILESALATDRIFPVSGGVYSSSPCTTPVPVPVCGTITTPAREIHFAFRVEDDLPLIGDTESRFTGRYMRGPDAPESLIGAMTVALNYDSTSIEVGFSSTTPFVTGINAHLIDLEVLADVRHYVVALSVLPDTLFDGGEATLIDTASVAHSLQVDYGWFQTIFDEWYPPPPEAVYGSYQQIKRVREDTTVTMSISYFAWEPYESISIPIRIKPIGVTAYIVPGSIITTEWAGPNNHLSYVLTAFPDSMGFWLQLYGGPRSNSFYQPYSAKPIVRFDVAISGPGLGVVVTDTARIDGDRPLEFVDSCPNSYLPEFGRGRIDVGVVSVKSEETPLPAGFELSEPYPNPFNAATTIGLKLAEPTTVCIEIVNLLGQEVETLWDGDLSAGSHEFVWSPADVASGLYFVRAQNTTYLRTAKLLLLK